MPSSKSPLSLQVGPGRLPANTIPASAFTTAPSPVAPVNEETTVIDLTSVTTGTTQLSRTSANMFVLLNNTTGLIFTVRLPLSPAEGDVVTLVGTNNGLAVINIDSSTLIHGFGSPDERFLGPFPARSFTFIGSGWVSIVEKPGVQAVTAGSTTLLRSGPSQVVLVDASAGGVILTLPQRAQLGDRLTIIKSVVTVNGIQIGGSGSDTIDGRVSTNIFAFLETLTLLRVTSTLWVTVSETSSVLEITDSLAIPDAAKEIHILVHTNNAAWIAGTKTVTLPSTLQTRVGQTVTISDVDGNAEAANITIASQILGTAPTGTSSFTLSHNYASVTLRNKSISNWNILEEDSGLVPDFSSLSRADNRSDVSQSRLTALPMYNWSHRKVALHAEFQGLITNVLPVDGFSAGGTMVLSPGAAVNGTVGVLRTTTTAGTVGYLHWGSTPTDDVFDPTQLLGFRAIFTPITANPGTDYFILIGFGNDISETGGSQDQKLGSNGLYAITGSTNVWRGVRQASGTASGFNSVAAVTAGNRYLVEYYNGGANWDLYVNGVRTAGGSSNKPTAILNFGLQVLNGTGVSNYVVDVDSFTVFTLDMGVTRFT